MFHLRFDGKNCLGSDGKPKNRYFTYADAESARLYSERMSGIRLRVYQCDICGYFHLTKKQEL